MRAWIEYSVPVLVQVDTHTREVVRVVQMDEEVRLGSQNDIYEDDGTGPNGAQITIPSVRQSIEDISESGEWPAWESGF